MPILIIESRGKRQAGTLQGRVLIGRWPHTAVMIDDRAVSRIHAWIGFQDGHYYVADAGSRTGTFVNGEPLHDRYFLADGDEIRIGPAILHYHIGDALPDDAEPIDLNPASAENLSSERGTFKDCSCGAPLWLPQHFSGVGHCRYCGRSVRLSAVGGPPPKMPTPPPLPPIARGREALPVEEEEDEDLNVIADEAVENEEAGTLPSSKPPPPPMPTPPPAMPAEPPRPPRIPISAGPVLPPAAPGPAPAPLSASAPPQPAKECGVCHSQITLFDETTACPSCGLVFHHDCWEENRGCSAYGCAQVGALAHEEHHA